MRRRVRAVIAAGSLVAGAAALAWGTRGHRPRAPLPAPSYREAAPPEVADFTGSEACSECHARQYRAWSRSTHGRAGGLPDQVAVIAPFDGRAMRFRDAVVTPLRTAGSRVFHVAPAVGPAVTIPVSAVVGGGHMQGGGTQSFFTESEDGTLRFLPFDWSAAGRSWFCATSSGWIPVSDTLSITACVEWPPERVLGGHERFRNCEQCHGSQIRLEFDRSARRYRTSFTTLAVNCESCHGPARRHVERARNGIAPGAETGIASLATSGADQSLDVCFQCHALKTQLRPGYLPGARLSDFYSLGLPHLVGRELFADGRITEFAYQEGHRWSECYRNGGMRCTDCHEPHGQGYRDVDGFELNGRLDDRQCTSCHASKVEQGERHTRHRPGSPGSRCVACHMPYLQQPGVGPLVPYARSDHAIPVPRPAFDARLGVVSACAGCHAGVSADSLEALAAAWWGALKPHDNGVRTLFKAESVRGRSEAAALLLAQRPRNRAAAVQGLAGFLRGFLSPDMPELEAAIVESLSRLGASEDPDVAALALASLHLARGEDRTVRATLAALLSRLGPADEGVRRRWAWTLVWVGDGYLARRDSRSALAAYRKAAEVLPGDPAVWRATGLALSAGGDHRGAEREFRRALAADSADVQAMVNLAFELQMLRDQAGSLALYRRALAWNPHEPATHFSYGNALARSGDLNGAIRAYQEAVRLKPRFAQASLALSRALAALGGRP